MQTAQAMSPRDWDSPPASPRPCRAWCPPLRRSRVRTAHNVLKTTVFLAAFVSSIALFSGAATAQQVDAAQQIAQIDGRIAHWYNYLNSLYSFANPFDELRYKSDPNYKRQYDEWVAYERQRGLYDIQHLQAQRNALVNLLQARQGTGTVTPGAGSTTPGTGAGGTGAVTPGAGAGGTGSDPCPCGVYLLGVCSCR